MVSRQHQDWINHGRPDSGLARPLAQLRDVLRAMGYVVYDQPDDHHLDDQPPQDHTYYSETGWPKPSPKWWRHAIDIMPGGKGLPTLQDLGQRLFMARQAGQITWLKYMNWPSTGNLDHAVQDRWEPDHQRSTSSDVGHIHISSITGVETLDAPYNPFASTPADTEGDDMPLSKEDIINVASAVVQWATRDGALPPEYRGAGTNLLSLEAQLKKVSSDLGAVATSLTRFAQDIEAIKAQLTELQAGATTTADVPITITGTGTAHIGGAPS